MRVCMTHSYACQNNIHIVLDDGMTNKQLTDPTMYIYFYKYSSGTHVNESCTHAYMYAIYMCIFCMMMA